MIDQAQGLRIMMNTQKNKQTKIITVTSGKGGVGKSSFTLNLAIALSRKGKRVLVVDMDFGFSNIDVMLGVNTKYDLMDIVNQNIDIREIIEVGHEGVQFVSGGSGVYELTKLKQEQLMVIVSNIISLENTADTIIFDTGAGVSDNILRLIRASHETILVTTPEPTAIVDAYALIKIISEEEGAPNLSLVLNKADNIKEAQTVMDGLVQIVRKNINIELKKLGIYYARYQHAKSGQNTSPNTCQLSKVYRVSQYRRAGGEIFKYARNSIGEIWHGWFSGKILSQKKLFLG